jgi:hypothetical protein
MFASFHNKNRAAKTESRARSGAFDGRLRQHYENITTYAVAFLCLAFARSNHKACIGKALERAFGQGCNLQ